MSRASTSAAKARAAMSATTVASGRAKTRPRANGRTKANGSASEPTTSRKPAAGKAPAPSKKPAAKRADTKKPRTARATAKKAPAKQGSTSKPPAAAKAPRATKATSRTAKKTAPKEQAAKKPSSRTAQPSTKTTRAKRPPPQPALSPASAPSHRAASAYRVDFGVTHTWPSVEVEGFTYAGAPGRPAVAEPGKPFVVAYHRSLADIDQHGELERIELLCRAGDAFLTLLLADGTLDPASGLLVRNTARIDVPADARGELEYWFRLTTTDGRVLWDSHFGQNYRAELLDERDVWVVFEGSTVGSEAG